MPGPSVVIPLSELHYRFSHSSGPGGQHVNRTATRVELLFDVRNSPSLDEQQRERVLTTLASYIDKDGVLHLASSASRSQLRNREEVTVRFMTLIRRALRLPKRRRPTRPTRESRERRLAAKRRRSQIKQERTQRVRYEE
ncbi:MAG: aminoacyl-tRNA hydrolase [Chloroflexi bacterium]|nr:aminoacyl-tRNA hydrolase [Chloroflexota bacterium]